MAKLQSMVATEALFQNLYYVLIRPLVFAARLRTGDGFGIPSAAGTGFGGVLRGRRYG
ncbi:hypothetical protein HFU84_07925 [Acidithiobacillus sp. CV18-2]|nr:hypothetical protein [Acidithiobacillus sp. CV18-3]MBU2758132.1 hypothetical protein [Acidithiobacillus sp. BN09-2]MBU2777431.1 hypothetical protein [Acidithiobacillus sp. CV18-2]MBU2800174.1 hypothetical protein [Acidithiobacillus sp. VAN18-4]